jgi:hypothetical protein
MIRDKDSFDTILDAGIKIGFLIMVVGIIMFYLPMLQATVDITFDYLQVWEKFRTFPDWVQVTFVGIVFVGLALIVGAGRGLVENMVLILFGKDEDF